MAPKSLQLTDHCQMIRRQYQGLKLERQQQTYRNEEDERQIQRLNEASFAATDSAACWRLCSFRT